MSTRLSTFSSHCTVFHLICYQRSPCIQTTLEGEMWYCQLAILPCDYLQSHPITTFIELNTKIQHLLLPFATGLAILRRATVFTWVYFSISVILLVMHSPSRWCILSTPPAVFFQFFITFQKSKQLSLCFCVIFIMETSEFKSVLTLSAEGLLLSLFVFFAKYFVFWHSTNFCNINTKFCF